ncbi:MAG: NTP transferase domain-containing protein [Deltaproteobacteria bacterium]|nr:NTP transferase domain-containing protein [Deltaproteobacteria bacterium]
MQSIKSAFVLAAGRGERLRPLTDTTPKPLLPVGGRPLLDFILENLIPLKLERVVLNAWHLKEQVVQYASERKTKFPFEILVSEENELLGTGGGLKKVYPLLNGAPFLMLNGDCLWKGGIENFVKYSLSQDVSSTWWLTEKDSSQTEVGAHRDRICSIGKLWSSNDPIENSGCFSGIQLIQKMDFMKLPDKGCIIRNYWLERLKEGQSLGACLQRFKSWSDIGTPERYQLIQNELPL